MGMYTELHFNAELKGDTPKQVLDILRFMVDGSEEEPNHPNHELFETKRWSYMLRGDSYYFDADTHSTLRFDDTAKSHYLCIRTNLKNYDEEIGKFIGWIMPYLAKKEGDFLGFWRYETDEKPALIFFNP